MWYMDNKDIINELMWVIDKWTNDSKNYKEASGRFLNEKLILRHSILTNSRKISKESVKNFLFHDVLELYPKNNGSKVGYNDINKNKKYKFTYDKLEAIFDRELNYRHIDNDFPGFYDVGLDGDFIDEIFESVLDDIPYSLLECVSFFVHEKFREFWKAAEEYEEVEDEDDTGDKQELFKKMVDAHDECIVATALFEIFIKEYAEETLNIAMKRVYNNPGEEIALETGRGIIVTRLVFKCYAAIVAVMIIEKAQYGKYAENGRLEIQDTYEVIGTLKNLERKRDIGEVREENRNASRNNSRNNAFIELFLNDYNSKNKDSDELMVALFDYLNYSEEGKKPDEIFNELYEITWKLMQPLWNYGSEERL